MSAWLHSRVMTAFLLAVCAGLGAVVVDGLDDRGPQAETGRVRVAISTPKAAAPADAAHGFAGLPEIGTLVETVERPLFEENRRPPSEEGPVAEAPTGPLHVFLTGIVIADGKRYAHIRGEDDARIRVLSEGDAVDSWRIKSIFPDRIVLSSGDRTEEILLKEQERAREAKPARRPQTRSRIRARQRGRTR